jgi:O-antigen ligase
LILLVVAGTLAASPLAFGYYSLTIWAPLGIGSIVLLVALVCATPPRLGGVARVAVAGGSLLLVLSFVSLLWAQSTDSAWSSANLMAVYAVVFAIGLTAIRDRVTAWMVILILGAPALVSALVLSGEFLTGDGGGAFRDGRLNAPMGYTNATAALLVMGIWPWLALAESARRPLGRAAAVSAAALIASTALLTQTRAVLLAAGIAIVIGLVVDPQRRRRAGNVLIVLIAVIAGSPWTLAVYSSTGPSHLSTPRSHVLVATGLALIGTSLLAGLIGRGAPVIWRDLAPRWRRSLAWRLSSGLVVVVAIAAGATGLVLRSQIAAQWHDFTTNTDEPSTSDRFLALGGGYRDDIWRIAVEEFLDEPLGGVGAGNYADQEYRRRSRLVHVSTPHSLELQMLAELGFGGAIGLTLFVAAIFAAALIGRRSREPSDTGPALRFAAIGMFAAWLAGTSVDWLYNFPGLTGSALLAAAVLVVPAPFNSPAVTTGARPRGSARGRVMLTFSVGALAVVAASLGRQYIAVLYSDSGQALTPRHPVRALRELRIADSLDPWSMQIHYAEAAAYARLDDYTDARDALLHAQRLEPDNYVPPALLGDLAIRAGLPRVALTEYRLALRLDPLEPALRAAVRREERAIDAVSNRTRDPD